MLAFLEAKKAGLLSPKNWVRNSISGVIVGVVALPLAIAFAIASGANPEQGLYTAIIAGFVVSAFGGSRVQIAGPTGAFVVLLAGITAKHGFAGLQIATLMAGGMLLVLGLTKMGAIVKFIPDPVILGFTAGIGVVIWVGQWKDFFGLPAVSAEHFHDKVFGLIQGFPQLHLGTALLAALSLLIVVFSPKTPGFKRVPGPFTALVLATSIQAFFQFEGIQTIGTAYGGIPRGLPSWSMPSFGWGEVVDLIQPAFAIAMLGAIESLLSAMVADGMAGTKHNSNQELIGQGLANMVTPLLGGFAATGAIARTATNIRNGGNSPISGIVHSATLVLVLLVFAPLAENIPLATLAAILFVVAWNMSEAKHFVKMVRRAPGADVFILLMTFGLTIFADLIVAVNIGVILATLHFLRKMANSVEFKQSTDQELIQEFSHRGLVSLPPGVLVFAVDGPFFFGAMENFERALAGTHTDPDTLIIRLKWVPFIDITGLQTLEDVILGLHRRGVRVLLSGANDKVRSKLAKAGILELVGSQGHFKEFEEALETCSNIENKSTADLP